MTDGGWAAFGSSSKGQENVGENDDDWADFGGFESAAPVTDSSEPSKTSGLISWAASFPATISLPTTQENDSANSQPSNNEKSPFTNAFPTAAVNTTNGNKEMLQSSIPAGTSDLTVQSSDANLHQETEIKIEEKPQVCEQSLSSIELDSKPTSDIVAEEDFELFLARNMPNSLSEKLQMSPIQVQNQSHRNEEKAFTQPAANLSNKQTDEMLQQLKESQKMNADLSDKVDLLQEKLSFADREKVRIQQDLEDLLDTNERQKQETEELKESLQKQTEKYNMLQETHDKQLKEIQEAGHEALAIIVQEYKELTRKAVLEQQEKNEIIVHQLLEEERIKFQQLQKDQQERFEQVLCEERQRNANTMQEALEEQKEYYQKEIESSLEDERKRSKSAVLKAVQDCGEEATKALSKAVEEECEKQKQIHEEQKAVFNTALEEMKRECRHKIEGVLQQEQKRNKDAVQEAIAEERGRGTEALSQAVDLTKQQLLDYMTEKEKADKVVRQKHYTAMDLFIEGTRNQLKYLMAAKQESEEV